MFYHADSFNQNLCGWDSSSASTSSTTGFCQNAITCGDCLF